MKTIVRAVVALITLISFSAAFAGERGWYVGGGVGQAKLDWDLQKKVDKEVQDFKKEGNQRIDQEIQKGVDYFNSKGEDFKPAADYLTKYQNQNYLDNVNIPITLNEDFKTSAFKVFGGYDFGNRWRVELSYKNYGKYSANASTGVDYQKSVQTAGDNYSADAEVHAGAHANASAEAKASSFGVSALFNVVETSKFNLFLRGGVERARATYSTTTTVDYGYGYGYDYNVNVNDKEYSDSKHVNHVTSETETTTKSISGYVPVIGLGMEFGVGHNMALRTEFERTGDPRKDGTRIDMYTLNLVKKF